MNYKALVVVSTILAFGSCGKKGQTEEVRDIQADLIEITGQQFLSGKMELGEPAFIPFIETVKCTGVINVKPGGLASISSPVPGIVRRINCIPGEKVGAGQVLFELSGNEFIELQKDLAETSSFLKRTRTEYERIKALFSENIGTEKELIMAETEFKITNARFSALKMKVKAIGLDPGKIEEGIFYDSFWVRSPIPGFISQINVTSGEYADNQKKLTDVLDLTKLQLRLSVFDKDINRLSEKQKVIFRLSGDRKEVFTAAIVSVGRYIDNDSKSISCIAEIDKLSDARFVFNSFVEAEIQTGTDTVQAVPEEAVLKSGENRYILSLVKKENDAYYFRKEKVTTGRLREGQLEILEREGKEPLLVKGAYNITIE